MLVFHHLNLSVKERSLAEIRALSMIVIAGGFVVPHVSKWIEFIQIRALTRGPVVPVTPKSKRRVAKVVERDETETDEDDHDTSFIKETLTPEPKSPKSIIRRSARSRR